MYRKAKIPRFCRKTSAMRIFAILIVFLILQVVNILWFRQQLVGLGLLEKRNGRYAKTLEAIRVYQSAK